MATDYKDSDQAGQLSADERALAGAIRAHLAGSLLPGEDQLSQERLDEAAAFMFEAARQRRSGDAALLIRSAHDGRRFTRFAFVNADMPFLVDSITATIAAEGLAIDQLAHPILPVRRDGEGRLTAVPDADSAGEKRESMIYLETARVDARERRALESELVDTITDTRAAIADWPMLRQTLEEDADQIGRAHV